MEFVARKSPPSLLWWAVLGAAMAAAWMAYRLHVARMEQAEDLRVHEAARQDVSRPRQSAAPAPSPNAAVLDELRRLREAPWPPILAALERVSRGDLQIQSIEIDVAARRADISVTAPSVQAVLEYVDALNAGVPPGSGDWRWSVWRIGERTHGLTTAEVRAER